LTITCRGSHGGGGDIAMIGAIGEDAFDEGKGPSHGPKHEQPAVSILNVRQMHHDIHEQAKRVDQDMSL
jgi:hypothetical protein